MMKKIMIMLAIALSMSMLNAASLVWTISRINSIDGASSVGSIAYLIDATVSGYDLESVTTQMAAVKDGNYSFLTGSTAVEQTATTTKFQNAGLSRVSAATFDGYGAGDYSFYSVVINEATGKYLITDQVDITYGGTGNLSVDFSSQLETATWQPVPEPTSGLLLLVGGALLALRRKQK